MLRHALLCCTMMHYAVLCCTMLHYAMLCYAILCCTMLCYAMLYHAMLGSHFSSKTVPGDLPWHARRKKKCYVMLCYAMLCYPPPPPPPSSSPPPCDMSRSQNEDKMSRCHSSLTCEDVKLSSCLSCQDVTCHARLLDCLLASFVTTVTRFGTS